MPKTRKMTPEEIEHDSAHVERVFGADLEKLRKQMENDVKVSGKVSFLTMKKRDQLMEKILEDKHKNERV